MRSTGLRLLALVTMLSLASLACGPLGPIPGGRLRGDSKPIPNSWSSIADVETFQLETRPADPHSVNIWSGVVDGQLYIATSLILGTDVPEERDWVQHVLEDPRVRLRAEGRIFELRALRVTDPAEVERAKGALMQKYEVEADEHAAAAWIFRLEAR